MLSCDYVVGLTEGEGCFSVSLRKPNLKYGSRHWRVDLRFSIKLREDDKELLEQVREFFGKGYLYFQKEKRKNHSHCWRFEISGLKNLEAVLIPFFEMHPLRGKKQKDFEIFKEIARLVKKKFHHTSKGIKLIKRLKKEMHKGGSLGAGNPHAQWERNINQE